MASPIQSTSLVGPDTLITVKVIIDGNNRRFKLALRDLGAHVLPQKLRFLLAIPPEVDVKFDRFSDSAGAYITLDSNNHSIYKQLYRAAKAKMKLRLRATVINPPSDAHQAVNLIDASVAEKNEATQQPAPDRAHSEQRQSYLETVLSSPPSSAVAAPFQDFQHSRSSARTGIVTVQKNATSDNTIPPAKSATRDILSKATLPTFHDFPFGAFSIDCNNCGESIPNVHYHCGTCEEGDFDLCQDCVDQGLSCDGDDHWLIKRFIRAGVVIPSTTETLPPKTAAAKELITDPSLEKPQAATALAKPVVERTCNSCISELPENELVTCKDCPDFDLCYTCFQYGEHGHHPAHVFEACDASSYTPSSIQALCKPGRGAIHEAVCDGCDKQISGVRHKCLNCPDWDYCGTCVLSADSIHPGHRFAPLYEPIGNVNFHTQCHYGIQCDGPVCGNRNPNPFIRGVRYKCAVCHDTDFCAGCEALPGNPHNKTHPLIKFKTPVRHVSVTTLGENVQGQKVTHMGDHFPRAKDAATETMPSLLSANTAAQVQTVAEVNPAEMPAPEAAKAELSEKSRTTTTDLQAWFESDSTPDGSRFGPNRLVSQSWTLRNPGPEAWPAGCAVYYIGGDDMRNLDANHPSSVSAMTTANRSNVLQHSLEPGKTAVFEVMLKSPQREGRVISYWRLKTPGGLPFGHKLWVDITVASTLTEMSEDCSAAPSAASVLPQAATVQDGEEIKSQQFKGDDTKSVGSSTMIFPKLEKESPESSIHEIVADVPSVSVAPTLQTDEQELLEDIESLELDVEETDDGFMTDEEYDILDASDEDFLIESEKASKM